MKKFIQTLKIFTIAIILTIGINWVSALGTFNSRPSCTPPACNVTKTIDTGVTSQSKLGGLTLGTALYPLNSVLSPLVVYGSMSTDSLTTVPILGVNSGSQITGNLTARHFFINESFFAGQTQYVYKNWSFTVPNNPAYRSLCIDTNHKVILCPLY